MERARRWIAFFLMVVVPLTPVFGAEDLYIRDDLADTGVQPNPSVNPMWLSPDIWVRNDPMPNWSPAPYPIASPPSWLDTTHFDPDYRSPLSGRPNWVYVRIRNRGTASTGNEVLRLYWASASTGLVWDPAKVAGSFIDNMIGNVLFGAEITKERKNAATATQAERDAYIAAIQQLATNPALAFTNGDSYWHTQQEIHRFGPPWRHGSGNPFVPSVGFLPWHREFVNRYEGLLQEANPTVKLLYWNWTQNPSNLYTNTFMGAGGAGQPAGVAIGAPLSPAIDPLYAHFWSGSLQVVRRQETAIPAEADATVVGRTQYDSATTTLNFSGQLERISHNGSHRYIAGYWGPATPFDPSKGGDQLFQPLAARDPFFFMLHAKVDELWARWQRKSIANLDPQTTYGSAQNHQNIAISTMGPWDGLAFNDGLPNGTSGQIEPWTAPGQQILVKNALDRSVTSPPFYDTAPLRIPVLQPNEEAIMEIPWYPPDPAKFGNVTDPNHVCLIARIETSTTSPFGMSTPETSDINFNTKQNNNIAWRNVSIIDTFPGPLKITKILVRNIFKEPVNAGLRLGPNLAGANPGAFFEGGGAIRLQLPEKILQRWIANGQKGRGFELPPPHTQLLVRQPDASIEGIALAPGELFTARLTYELQRDYRPTKRGEPLIYDIVQTGAPAAPDAVVGGQRYAIDLEKLTPVKRGATWRFLPGPNEPQRWTSPEFPDSAWLQRRLDFGVTVPTGCEPAPTTLYLRNAFNVDDPSFFRNLLMRVKRSDAVRIFLNGTEVYRFNLPDGPVNARTLARTPVRGSARNAYFPVRIDPALLKQGRNVLAAEVHRAADNRGPVTFDVELNGNWQSPQLPPDAEFVGVLPGQLLTVGKTASIELDALDVDGSVRGVTFLLDDKRAQASERAPFRFNWKVEPGPHRLTAVVTDDAGLQSKSFITLTGVSNVPPAVELTQPSQHAEFLASDPIVAVARASDPDGNIKRVEFYVMDSVVFGDPARLLGTATAPPWALTLRGLKPGHNMLIAVAWDDGGARSASTPVMVMVNGNAQSTTLPVPVPVPVALHHH